MDSSGTGPVQLRALPGIPDRNFADAEHQFLYLPVVAEDGNTWLNNNLGAHYADVNHPSFNPAQQATAIDDHLAYGSLYQWGRLSDGHELTTWTGPDTGTPVNNGTTLTRSSTDNPGNALFILGTGTFPPLTNRDWRDPMNVSRWQDEAGDNNPCPEGYRVPSNPEWTQLCTDEGIINIATGNNSNLALTTTGYRFYDGGYLFNGTNAFYWSTTTVSNNSGQAKIRRITSGNVTSGAGFRTSGLAVRCIQD